MNTVNEAARQLLVRSPETPTSFQQVAPQKAAPPERNKPCPCGSGKKSKKCCLLTVLPEEHALNVTKDESGLPLEHAGYVEARCKACDGKGYERVYVLGEKRLRTCTCVHRGYSEVRLDLKEKVSDSMKAALKNGFQDAAPVAINEESSLADKQQFDRYEKFRAATREEQLKLHFAHLL